MNFDLRQVHSKQDNGWLIVLGTLTAIASTLIGLYQKNLLLVFAGVATILLMTVAVVCYCKTPTDTSSKASGEKE